MLVCNALFNLCNTMHKESYRKDFQFHRLYTGQSDAMNKSVNSMLTMDRLTIRPIHFRCLLVSQWARQVPLFNLIYKMC